MSIAPLATVDYLPTAQVFPSFDGTGETCAVVWKNPLDDPNVSYYDTRMKKELLKGHSELLVLAALAHAPMHGYALSEYLKDEMADAFRFGVGMLYPLLHKLEQDKLIEGKWETLAGQERRVYTLTKKGKKALADMTREWVSFTSLVSKAVIKPS